MDVRASSIARKGHISGAVNFTVAQLKKSKKKFPKIKSAPIIIYADSRKQAKAAFKIIRKWGYKNASILEGGVAGWTRVGNSLVRGQLASRIVYVPKPVKGSISRSQFKTIAATMPDNAVILDVRDANEASAGMIPGAINIPTQDIAARLNEIPKDKRIVVHCKTGIRASMAYQTLKEKGYNVLFLNGKITISSNGAFRIKS